MAAEEQQRGQRTKRCHWVPQAYLRAFAADAPDFRRIWRFSRHHEARGPELKRIDKVAVRLHLYAPIDPKTGKRDDSFERKLSHLEQWFGHKIWQILCTDIVDLRWKPLRKMVSLLIAVMYFRNPANFAKYKEIHQQLRDEFLKEEYLPDVVRYMGRTYSLDKDSWPAYRDAQEEDLKRNWIESISHLGWCAEQLMQMRWAMVCAEESIFITSDNPVTTVHPSLRFRGIKNPETIIMFPISPTRMLHLDNRHEEEDGHYYRVSDDGSAANLLVWRGANEYMFSHRHPEHVCRALLADAERRGFMGPVANFWR